MVPAERYDGGSTSAIVSAVPMNSTARLESSQAPAQDRLAEILEG